MAANKKSTFLGIFAVLIWSFAALFAVELTSVPAFEILFCQLSIGFLITIARYAASSEKKSFFNFPARDLGIATLALVLNQIFYFTAFREAPAAQVDLINYQWPTMLIILSSFLPKEKFSISYFIACLLSIFGLYILIPPEELQNSSSEFILGYALAFAAGTTWALYSLYTRYRGSANSANCISWASGPAAIVCLLIHLKFEQFVAPNLFEASLILILGVFQTGLAFYFWERGLKKGSVKILGLSSYAIPVLSVLLLVVFGKADFEPRMVTATIIISLSPLVPLISNKLKTVTAKNPSNSTRLATAES